MNKTLCLFLSGIATLQLFAPPAFANEIKVERLTPAQVEKDYEAVIFLLSLPPEQRKEGGRFMAIVGSVGVLGMMGTDAISKKVMQGLQRRIFARVLSIGYSMGAVLIIDGFFGYVTNGKFFPIMMVTEELITLVRPAHAATMEEYFLQDGEHFKEFMALDKRYALQYLSFGRELAGTVHVLAEACRQQFGADTCKR